MTYQEMCENAKNAFHFNPSIKKRWGSFIVKGRGSYSEIIIQEMIDDFNVMCRTWCVDGRVVLLERSASFWTNSVKYELKYEMTSTKERQDNFHKCVESMLSSYTDLI
jgi:hypothetical protein